MRVDAVVDELRAPLANRVLNMLDRAFCSFGKCSNFEAAEPAMAAESAEPRIDYKEVAREAIGSIGDIDDSVEACV